jgi:hypothetical protein
MGWIKRNLFFAIGLATAVLLLGGAAFYAFQGWRNNQDARAKLEEVYGQIQQDNNYKPSPGNSLIDNIQIAKDQQKQLQQWLVKSKDYFQPIPPIPNPPNGQVTSEMFAPALSQTVRELEREAQDDNVQLPPSPYFFSFTAQSDKAVFDATSLGQVAQQLGDVKDILDILLGARINALESIQRVAVSKDDTQGDQGDYITDQPVTENMVVLTPYQVTFRGFSSDIANVLAAFASSTNGFIVQNISVEPATATATTMMSEENSRMGGPAGRLYNPSMQTATPVTTPTRNGLQTILNEQMLRVTLKIEVVRLTPNT